MKNTALFVSCFLLVLLALIPTDADAKGFKRCGRNAVFSKCGTACPRICGQPIPQFCTFQCVIGCVCKKGYILSGPGGECISEKQCRLGH